MGPSVIAAARRAKAVNAHDAAIPAAAESKSDPPPVAAMAAGKQKPNWVVNSGSFHELIQAAIRDVGDVAMAGRRAHVVATTPSTTDAISGFNARRYGSLTHMADELYRNRYNFHTYLLQDKNKATRGNINVIHRLTNKHLFVLLHPDVASRVVELSKGAVTTAPINQARKARARSRNAANRKHYGTRAKDSPSFTAGAFDARRGRRRATRINRKRVMHRHKWGPDINAGGSDDSGYEAMNQSDDDMHGI